MADPGGESIEADSPPNTQEPETPSISQKKNLAYISKRYELECIFRAMVRIYELPTTDRNSFLTLLEEKTKLQAKRFNEFESNHQITTADIVRSINAKTGKQLHTSWREAKEFIHSTMLPIYLTLVDSQYQPRSGKEKPDVLSAFRQKLWDHQRTKSSNKSKPKDGISPNKGDDTPAVPNPEGEDLNTAESLQCASSSQLGEDVQLYSSSPIEQTPLSVTKRPSRRSKMVSETVPDWFFPSSWNIFVKYGLPSLIGNPKNEVHVLLQPPKPADSAVHDKRDLSEKSRKKQRMLVSKSEEQQDMQSTSSIAGHDVSALRLLGLEPKGMTQGFLANIRKQRYESDIQTLVAAMNQFDKTDPRYESLRNVM